MQDGTNDANRAPPAAPSGRLRRFPWLAVLFPCAVIGAATWNIGRAWPALSHEDVAMGILAVVTAGFFAYVSWTTDEIRDKTPLILDRIQDLISRQQQVFLSIHHLFNQRDLLRPRGGGNVDMILDAADLPSALVGYLKDVRVAGATARILVLDPTSALIERHRFVQQAGGDEISAVQHFRAKINSAIAELGSLATVRVFDALPPGNLIIVDDHIFWGGVPSVPSDASYPIIGITADTREHVYWAFRRNFDVLWKQAKPVDTDAPRATRSIAAASL